MRALKPQIIWLFAVTTLVLIVAQCGNRETERQSTTAHAWMNHGDSAQYVGIQTCRECHADIYETYVETGMGQSFGPATREKSAGDFVNHNHLYDSLLDYHYNVAWRDDSLVVYETRSVGFEKPRGDALYDERPSITDFHFRKQPIDYIVGSGQHTNSHIFSEHGYLFQAPFTYYTQQGKLDFPPGFENGNNARFSRPIGLECMSCHNAMPTAFVAGSENKFDLVPNGIDCERCHGPGSIHVNRIKRGIAVDTSKGPDFSIVNPKRLTPDMQFEICQRCHLQGNTVLVEGKSFFDFKPGMYLDSVMDIYLPRYTSSNTKFIMASHVDRFTQSACYLQGKGQFVCTSCHNPHVSVQKTDPGHFNKSCKSCHNDGADKHECTADFANMDVEEINCVECHMPSSGSIDIPHVTVHDHYIRKPEEQKETTLAEDVFLGLAAINTKKPGKRSRIKAYLQQFERFEANPIYLDSVRALLEKMSLANFRHEWVHYYYLRNDPGGIVKLVEENGKAEQWLAGLNKKSWDNQHAWTAYRIAEGYRKFKDYQTAIAFATRSVELAPNHPEFLVKQSSIYALLNDFEAAEKGNRKVLEMNPQIAEAWSNLGYVLLAQNELNEAEEAILEARKLDPDYRQARVNLASVYLSQERWADARKLLEALLRENPQDQRVKGALDYLNMQNLGV
jgi:tetratricopeptide (TPR) repeat protein